MPTRSSATRIPQPAQDETLRLVTEPLNASTKDPQPNLPNKKSALILRIFTIRGRSVSVKRDSGTVEALRRFGRKAAVILGIGASVAEAVPVLGAPVKGALEAAIKVQTILEVSKISVLLVKLVLFVVFIALATRGISRTKRRFGDLWAICGAWSNSSIATQSLTVFEK